MKDGRHGHEDLYLVPSEDSLDDDGEPIYCVFSEELDAVTFVDAEELSASEAERHPNARSPSRLTVAAPSEA